MAKKKVSFWSKLWAVVAHNRVRAFVWTVGAMATAYLLDFVLAELVLWNPNHEVTICAGLVFAQITKALNNKFLIKK